MAESRNAFHVCTENIPYRKRYGKGNEDEKNDEDGAVADRNIRGAL